MARRKWECNSALFIPERYLLIGASHDRGCLRKTRQPAASTEAPGHTSPFIHFVCGADGCLFTHPANTIVFFTRACPVCVCVCASVKPAAKSNPAINYLCPADICCLVCCFVSRRRKREDLPLWCWCSVIGGTLWEKQLNNLSDAVQHIFEATWSNDRIGYMCGSAWHNSARRAEKVSGVCVLTHRRGHSESKTFGQRF